VEEEKTLQKGVKYDPKLKFVHVWNFNIFWLPNFKIKWIYFF